MTKKIFYDILTGIALIMAIVQAPFIYYYTFGLVAFFMIPPYLFIGLGLTALVKNEVSKNPNLTNIKFQTFGLIVTIIIGTTSLFFGENVIENIDWKYRKSMREQIVELVKTNKLKPNVAYNNIICSLDDSYFPPISNGGNEIAIYKTDGNITIEFYINRGFLDNYSAFVYTDDPKKRQELEEIIALKSNSSGNKKLDKNWYRVSY